MNNTNTRKTCKRLIALFFALTAALSVLSLPVSAKSASGFQYYLTESYEDDEPDFAVITGHASSVNGTLTIPDTIGGHKVQMIAAAAFSGRRDIRNLVLLNEWIMIDEHAFENCSNLKTVTCGECYIYDGAFDGCTSLRTVNITCYKHDYFDPAYAWNETDNEALLNADWNWTRYAGAVQGEDVTMNVRTERRVTIKTDYTLKEGESYHWYSVDGGAFSPDECWDEYTGDTVRGKILWNEEGTVACEVVNDKGNVVYTQNFVLHVRPTFGYTVRNAFQDTYLYGVSEYTISHIRWRVYNCLDALGVEY